MIKKKYILITVFASLFPLSCLLLTCNKIPKEMKVVTGEVTNITQTSASVVGEIIDIGEEATEYGHCYNIIPGASISHYKTQFGKPGGPKSFSSSLSALEPGIKYYVKAYISNANRTIYGEEKPFETLICNAPTATTNAATSAGTTTATLNGTVDASGSTITVTFEYGLTTSYGSSVTATQSPVTGNTSAAVSAGLTGLTGGTTYNYRIKTENCGGTVYGSNQTFITGCTAPTATINAATGVGTTTATPNGTVNANGSSTTVTFEYGLTTSYGSTVTAVQSPVSGSSNTTVSAGLTGLTPGVTYNYRLKAVNCGGTVYGSNQNFTTGCTAPTATTNAATSVGTTTATLNGTVNANGFSTTVTFEYGLTTSYGSTVTATQSPVTGSTNTAVSAGLTGLTPGVTYHYRVKAVSCGSTVNGANQTFTTV